MINNVVFASHVLARRHDDFHIVVIHSIVTVEIENGGRRERRRRKKIEIAADAGADGK